MTRRVASTVRLTPVGVVIAALAAFHQVVLESVPTNDDFLHLALARQLLGGELPVRDFSDSGLTLQYGLSAVAESLFGHRLLSEAIVVAVAFFVSTAVLFALVRRLTGSTLAAASAAVLLLLAGPRGYSYPKIIVYSVAASLWWRYVLTPTRAGAVALGVWTAVAFYWRPDHGLYVAAGVALAMVAAHGFRLPVITRSVLSGGTTIALLLHDGRWTVRARRNNSRVDAAHRDGFACMATMAAAARDRRRAVRASRDVRACRLAAVGRRHDAAGASGRARAS